MKKKMNQGAIVNTDINQIIEETEISKSSLYQHFRAKEDLLIVYLEPPEKTRLTDRKMPF